MDTEIANALSAWIEEQEETNPIHKIYLALLDGSITYRDYLKLITGLADYFCNTLGFVPDYNLSRIIEDKLIRECLNPGNMTNDVRRIVNGIRNLPAAEDDFI